MILRDNKLSVKIIAVGIEEFPSDNAGVELEFVPYRKHCSLIDADMVLLFPTIFDEFNLWASSKYRGKQCINQEMSGEFVNDLNFWDKEIDNAIKAGIMICIVCVKPIEFYYYTGEKEYSGTGRNRQIINDVKLINSYFVCPGLSVYHASFGASIKYNSKNAILRTIWEENKDCFQYEVTFEEDNFPGEPILYQNKGNGILGGIISTSHNSHIIVLPAFNLNDPKFIDTNQSEDGTEEESWTDIAVIFANKFVKNLISINKTLKNKSELSPPPDWVSNKEYEIEAEKKIENKILLIEKRIQDLTGKKLIKERELENTIIPKRLLYEAGTPLEDSLKHCLSLIGFKAESYQDNESQFDVVFTCSEGAFLGEAEGKEKKAIDVKKISQLMRNLSEYISKPNVKLSAKGVLFGNGYRFTPPAQRAEQFTTKCISVAEQHNILLIRTMDLFPIYQYLLEHRDRNFKKQCREAIVNSQFGLVKFPNIPE